jgi:hypothetical protein
MNTAVDISQAISKSQRAGQHQYPASEDVRHVKKQHCVPALRSHFETTENHHMAKRIPHPLKEAKYH